MAGNKAKFIGKVVLVKPTENIGKDGAYKKRTIVVTDSDPSDKRQNEVPFDSFGDKCDYLDGYKAGDVVTIDYYPNGRRWHDPKTNTDRFFASFGIAFIKKGAEEAPAEEEAVAAEAVADGDVDDMPF